MKTFKKTISVMLTALLILSVFSVCVSAKTKTVKWQEDDRVTTFNVREDLKTGKNTFSHSGNSAHVFAAPKEGMYAISFSAIGEDYGYSVGVSKGISSGNPFGRAESYCSEKYGEIYFFKKDQKRYICAETEGSLKSYTVTLTYLGKVTSVSLKDSKIPLQGNIEISHGEEDGKQYYYFQREMLFKTDSGKNVYISGLRVATAAKSLKSGKLTATVNTYGIKKDISFSVFFASEEIKSISKAKGFVAPTVSMYKDGSIAEYSINEESLNVAVKLKDGKTVQNEGASECAVKITLPDGKKMMLYPSIEVKNGKPYLVATDEKTAFVIAEAKKQLVSSEGEPIENTDFSLRALFEQAYEFFSGLFKKLLSVIPSLFESR